MKEKKPCETFSLSTFLSHNHSISHISSPSFSARHVSLIPPSSFFSRPRFLFLSSLSLFPHPPSPPISPHRPPPPSFRTHSLIASCCHKSNYIGVVSMGNRLSSCHPSSPSFPPHHTVPPSSYLPRSLSIPSPPPIFISLSIYISPPSSSLLSHTQNEKLCGDVGKGGNYGCAG